MTTAVGGRPNQFELINDRLDGRLSDIIRAIVIEHGNHPEEVWYWLRSRYDVTVSTQTVRRWLVAMGLYESRTAAAQERAS